LPVNFNHLLSYPIISCRERQKAILRLRRLLFSIGPVSRELS